MPRHSDDQQGQSGTISRRVFIESAIAATAVVAGVTETSRSLRSSGVLSALPLTARGHLAPEQLDQLSQVLNRLIPVGSGRPAAGDLRVGAFIDDVIVEAPHLHVPVSALLARLDELNAFSSEATGDTLDGLLRQVERENPKAFDVLVRLTYVGYYGDPRVRTALGWDSPANVGVFDSNQLENVKRRYGHA